MLQDKYLPEYDVITSHSINLFGKHATPLSLLERIDVSQSFLIRCLYRLRGIKAGKDITGSLREKFIELERDGEREIIFGLVGQFWKPGGNIQVMSAGEFMRFNEEGFLKATWNFKTTARRESEVVVETETRVKCFGKEARRRFMLYWFFVKPFSGVIRKEILRLLKKNATQLQ